MIRSSETETSQQATHNGSETREVERLDPTEALRYE